MSSSSKGLWDYVKERASDRGGRGWGRAVRATAERWRERLHLPLDVDFEAEGLFEGVDGEAREARLGLLRQLYVAGVSLEELRRAVAEDRLALLPVEQVLSGEGEMTLAETAERCDLAADVLADLMQALALTRPEPDSVLSADAVEAASAIRELMDAGLPKDGLLDVARVLGHGIEGASEAIRDLVGETFLRPGDTEHELGLRYAAVTKELGPQLVPLMRFTLTMHLLELIRTDVVTQAHRAAGELPGARRVAVCFADLSEFTTLSERLSAEEIGEVTRRLDQLTRVAARPPVRVIKTVGDAAMLVSPEAEPLVDAALDLVAAAEAEGEGFPRLHAGIAIGHAVSQSGDWYGWPVNLASRVAALADPSAVLVTDEVRETVGEGRAWSELGRRRLKGVDQEVSLFRVDGNGGRGGRDGSNREPGSAPPA